MPDYKVTNRGKPLPVLTLSSNFPAVTYDQLLATNATSTATVQAFYFPEARHVYIPGIATLRKAFGPGRVNLTDLGVPPTADFIIDTWEAPTVPGGHSTV